MKRKAEDILASYVEAYRPIIYIQHFDFPAVDKIIAAIAKNIKVLEYNEGLGAINFDNKSPLKAQSLVEFLLSNIDDGFDQETFLVLKDIHASLHDPHIIALLKRIAEFTISPRAYCCTVFIVATKRVIPTELENYITLFDMPLPNDKEILTIITTFAEQVGIHIDENVKNSITLSFKGLSEFQIIQILNLAYQEGGFIDKNDKHLILREKEQFIKKSGMLEIVNFNEKIENIGGLDILKSWLKHKAEIFKRLDEALKFGVDTPKGIMIVGMPGCGKSLTAKACAALFQIPLVRLDIGRLLGKYVGESEENMRKALLLSEAISPCILWIDEVEKAFSGIGGSGGASDITTRLFGQFLTWLQEKENTVFIVATANDISNLPPEFLRKGRFDEVFFVDLPQSKERKEIIDIHLRKRKKWNNTLIKDEIIKKTHGYSGADLEFIVKETVERAFIAGKNSLNTEDLLQIIDETKPISETLKEKVKFIQESVDKFAMKKASSSVNSTEKI